MRHKLSLITVFLMLSILPAVGQDLRAIAPRFKPGDALRYRVEFDGDPKFDSVGISFYLQGNPLPNQPGLSGYIPISHSVKVSPGVFDVDGTIPANAATGAYEVRWVNATISPASKQYDATGLHITIRVDNDSKYDFPALKLITPRE